MSSHLLLRWDNHLPSFASCMKECLDEGELTDLTISCEGKVLKAHKLVLSVASPHFKQLLKANPGQHPIIIMRDIPYKDMSALLTFIYQGEVTVTEDELPSFLKTAKALEVRGLADGEKRAEKTGTDSTPSRAKSPKPALLEPEVLVKEEPPDDSDSGPDGQEGALPLGGGGDGAALNSTANDDCEGGGHFMDVTPIGPAPKAGLERTPGSGRGSLGAGRLQLAEMLRADVDPAAANLDDVLIPGMSTTLDRILRKQLSLPDRGFFCPYCTREVNMRTLGKHMTKIHGGMRLQCKACREVVHTRVTSLLINHGVCVLLLYKNSKLGDALIRKLSHQIRAIYKNRRFKSQMLRRYPDLAYFSSSFIFGRVKQACERCGLVLWSSSMASHLEKCGEDVIQCDFCNKHMARTRLPDHIDIFHPGKVIAQKVPEVPAITAGGGSGTVSPIAHPVFSVDEPEDDADSTPSNAQIVPCPTCHKRMRQNNLRRHMRVMHEWRPSMKLPEGADLSAASVVNPATGLMTPPVPEKEEDEDDEVLLSGGESDAHEDGVEEHVEEVEEEMNSGEEGEGGQNASPTKQTPFPQDDRYAIYKRQCPVCSKVMWKKYLGSHIRSAHPERVDIDDNEIKRLTELKPFMQVSRAKQLKHCPYCWKTMWRCNVKRHIRQVHPDHAHKLTDDFDLHAEITKAARARGEVPPPASDPSDDEAEIIDEEDDTGTEAPRDEATLAIQEMNAMAEAEGLEALEHDDEHVAEQLMMQSEIVSTESEKHEKNLKRCRICRKLLRGCHLKRHMLNWHSPMATGKMSTKTGVPGGLKPARQRTCPVCRKIVVVNNLRRHIRASHPEVREEELVDVTDASRMLSHASPYAAGAGQLAGKEPGDSEGEEEEVEEEGDMDAEPELDDGDLPYEGNSSNSYAQRRMRRCPYCPKVMVSSNMARHCKTHHPDEWAATHGGGVEADGRGAAGMVLSRAAAEAALEEMEAMNAEEAAALLDEEGGGEGAEAAGSGDDQLMDEEEALAEFEDEEAALAAAMEDELAEPPEDLEPPDEDAPEPLPDGRQNGDGAETDDEL